MAILSEEELIASTTQNNGKIILTPQTQNDFSVRLSQESNKVTLEKLSSGHFLYVVHMPISRGGLSVGAVNEHGLEGLLATLGDSAPKLLSFPLQAESYMGEGRNQELSNVWGIAEALAYLLKINVNPEQVLFQITDDVSESNQTSAFTQKKIVEKGFLPENIFARYIFDKPSKRRYASVADVNEIALFDTAAWIIYYHELYDVGGEGPDSERVASIAYKDSIITDAIYGDPRLMRAVNEYIIDPRTPNLNRLYIQQLLLAKDIILRDTEKRPYEKTTGVVLTVYSSENILPMGVTTHELMRLFTKDDKLPVIPHHGVVAINPEGVPYLVGGQDFLKEVDAKLKEQGYAYQSPIRARLMGLKDNNTPLVRSVIGKYLADRGFQLEF